LVVKKEHKNRGRRAHTGRRVRRRNLPPAPDENIFLLYIHRFSTQGTIARRVPLSPTASDVVTTCPKLDIISAGVRVLRFFLLALSRLPTRQVCWFSLRFACAADLTKLSALLLRLRSMDRWIDDQSPTVQKRTNERHGRTLLCLDRLFDKIRRALACTNGRLSSSRIKVHYYR